MEEQFDYMMGIHKDGRMYTRWINNERKDAKEATGTDALSYARGRATKKKKTSKRYVSIDDTPFWEKDGSLVSILFGGTGRGDGNPRGSRSGSIGDDLYKAIHTNSLSLILKTVSVFVARIIGSLCRWASVYDTIPRPLVGVTLLTAGIVSRGSLGSRIRNIVFAVLSMRVIGEWMYGFLSLDEDDAEEVEK
jgi:hypothetical protein